MKIMETRTCTCRLKAMYTETLPLNIVPTATNLPSSETAKADKLSLHGTAFFNEPSFGSHSCRNAFCLPRLPTGFTSIKSRVLFTFPSTKPNLVTINVSIISESTQHSKTCESGYPVCLPCGITDPIFTQPTSYWFTHGQSSLTCSLSCISCCDSKCTSVFYISHRK